MFYLIRHAETDWNINKKIQGQTNIPLNYNGKKQAEIIAKKLKNLHIDKIISSDLLRAKETAKIINKELNVKLIIDNRIKEANFGKLEGLRKNDFIKDNRSILSLNLEELNGEPIEKIYNRIKDFFDEFKNSKENILIISHTAILRVIMYYSKNPKQFNKDLFYKQLNSNKIKNLDIFEWDKEIKLLEY